VLARWHPELAAFTRLIGADHRGTLVAENNLAETLSRMGELAEARARHEHVLAARTRELGLADPDTLVSLSNVAHTIYEQGDVASARALLDQAVVLLTRVVGPEHPSTLTTMAGLAVASWKAGDLETARTLPSARLRRARAHTRPGPPGHGTVPRGPREDVGRVGRRRARARAVRARLPVPPSRARCCRVKDRLGGVRTDQRAGPPRCARRRTPRPRWRACRSGCGGRRSPGSPGWGRRRDRGTPACGRGRHGDASRGVVPAVLAWRAHGPRSSS